MNFDETAWWSDCGNTWHEEQKQFAYAKRMGLRAQWGGAHPPTFDLEGRSVLDIGGGPVSLLLKCVNRGGAVVADPGKWPPWVLERYRACGIDYWPERAEELEYSSSVDRFDEAWIYNVLQHVDDPALVIENARAWAHTIRVFEWIDIPPYPGHPHELTQERLDFWLGSKGYTATLNESGAVGRAYYGVLATT